MKLVKSLKRIARYCYLKMVKEKGPPEYVARGWAVGVAANWILPIGQMPLALALSFLFRGSKIGALLGTWLTNPLTTLFLYPLQCYVGSLILSSLSLGRYLSFSYFEQALHVVIEDKSWDTTLEAIRGASFDVVFSFLVGGAVFVVISAPATYFLTHSIVTRFRRIREKRAALKRAARQECAAQQDSN